MTTASEWSNSSLILPEISGRRFATATTGPGRRHTVDSGYLIGNTYRLFGHFTTEVWTRPRAYLTASKCMTDRVRDMGESWLNSLLKLDRIDLNILDQLQRDGRMTNASLAQTVGLSASPCLQRVKRLESAGLITGYRAQINLAKLTESITVFTEITLIDHRREDFVRFEANLRNVDELMECHLVSGGYDYLLRFVCRNIGHYQRRMENLLERSIGIEKYFSYIVLKSPIIRNAMPIKTLLDALL